MAIVLGGLQKMISRVIFFRVDQKSSLISHLEDIIVFMAIGILRLS